MSGIEDKLAGKILKIIRARRKARSVASSDRPLIPPAGIGAVKVREVQFSDFEAVQELKKRWGLSPDSMENWDRLWRQNPALQQPRAPYPMGWVLDTGDKIVGYLGNIVLRYFLGDQALIAATSHGFVVEPEYRGSTTRLSAAFYRQPAVDIYLTTTAIEAVARISRAFKADPLPQADYDTVLFWVLRPYRFAKTLIKRLGARNTAAEIGARLASLAIGAEGILRGRRPRRPAVDLVISDISVEEIGEQFEAFWSAKRMEGNRLLADRSAGVLRWHFTIPGDRGSVRVLCCYERRDLAGYAIVRHDPSPDGGQKSMVADLLVKQDKPEVIAALWHAAYEHAGKAGSDVFEVLGFPENIRHVCSAWRPYQRKYPACPFYYRASDPGLHTRLSDGAAWYASPFDGDTSLIRPSYSSAVQVVSIQKENETSPSAAFAVAGTDQSEVGRR